MRSTTERRGFHRPRPSLCVSLLERLVFIFCFSLLSSVSAQEYIVPPAILEALTPRGLRVSIPDSPGVQLFAFHGNINKPMRALEAGDLSQDVIRRTGDRWVYTNDRVRLKLGDVINYWTYVQVDGRGYRLDDQTWQVTEWVSASSPTGGSRPFDNPNSRPDESTNGGFGASNSHSVTGTDNLGESFGNNEGNSRPPTTGNLGGSFTGNNGGNSRPLTTGNLGGSFTGNSGGNSRPAATTENFGDSYTSNNGGNSRPAAASTGNFGDTFTSSNGNSRPTASNNFGDSFTGSNGNSRPTTPNNFGDSFTANNAENSRPSGNTNRPTGSNIQNIRPTDSFGETSGKPMKQTQTAAAAPAQHCVLSTTTVNGRPACKNYVIFEENFRSLDLRRWARDIRIPSNPDFEFCVFSEDPDTLWVQNDALHIRPKLTEDRYGEDFVRTGNLVLDGCTAGPTNAESCSRQAVFSYILPPTLSAKVTTKDSFRFRYGVLEIRAKLPLGDWIYPEILLLPYLEQYGPGISSGRVQLAMARGNRQLRSSTTGSQLGAKRLEYGVSAGTAAKILHRDANRQWADQFHNYSLLWTPETMAFSVDGVELGIIRPESYGGLLRSDNGRDPWSNGDVSAPFDKEFYLSLGVAVGGVRTFPDDAVTGENVDKPWSNTDAKAMLRFWNAKQEWYPTWGDKNQLVIESIRVTALNH